MIAHPDAPLRPESLNTPALFRSAPPAVRLVREESATHPFATAVAAAWSCYGAQPASVDNVIKLVYQAPKNGLDERKLAARESRRQRAIKLYADLFAAGHHTTFQHAHFVFVLDNVSRLAIWSFFHSHPFFNSEQVSQRYREVSGEVMAAPDLPPDQASVYDAAIEASLEGYRRLVDVLSPDMEARYASVFPARVKSRDASAQQGVASAVQKRAQEVARYVLPLATPAHLYHTVNGLTLLRYYVLANQPDAPTEVRYIINRMVAEVLDVDPYFLGGPGHPLKLSVLGVEQSLEAEAFQAWRANMAQHDQQAEEWFDEFDARMDGLQSRLASWNPDSERIMADAIRAVLAVPSATLSDADAIAAVLDGSQNGHLGHPVFLGMHSKLMQTMNHVPFTFQKVISGAEDAQNQRHRGTPSSSPMLTAHLRRDPDVITPWAIEANAEALSIYRETVAAMWDAKNRLLDAGASPESVLYLLPNAHRVRFYESGTLLGYYWKWVKRLCLDAQKEISDTAIEEVAQVREVLPTIGAFVDGPPCVMRSRSGARPICPEGERYCGIPVWRDYRFEELAGKRVM